MVIRHRGSSTKRRVVTVAVTVVLGGVLVQCARGDAPAELPQPVEPEGQFHATVHPVTVQRLGASWRPGCPVEPAQLRLVELGHVGMDGKTHVGELIVNQDRVPQVIEAFEQLYRLRYPIEKMRTVEHYPNAEDELSMQDNNTSGFNCRGVPGTGRWSNHAYGRAIDINALFNPYLKKDGTLQPKNAGPYLDRMRQDPGLLHAEDPEVRVFVDRGWTWGGGWSDPIDYQHFEKP